MPKTHPHSAFITQDQKKKKALKKLGHLKATDSKVQSKNEVNKEIRWGKPKTAVDGDEKKVQESKLINTETWSEPHKTTVF